MDEKVVKDICHYIIDNINDEISLSLIADEFNYNTCHILRTFKEYTGFTIIEFINECRVYNTIDPLVFTDDTVLKIALMHGFNSQEYYSEKFKGVIGVSPLRFRKIFSILAQKVIDTSDIEELKIIKGAFEELKDYQQYLNGISSEFTSKEEKRKERPNVKTMKLQ